MLFDLQLQHPNLSPLSVEITAFAFITIGSSFPNNIDSLVTYTAYTSTYFNKQLLVPPDCHRGSDHVILVTRQVTASGKQADSAL